MQKRNAMYSEAAPLRVLLETRKTRVTHHVAAEQIDALQLTDKRRRSYLQHRNKSSLNTQQTLAVHGGIKEKIGARRKARKGRDSEY